MDKTLILNIVKESSEKYGVTEVTKQELDTANNLAEAIAIRNDRLAEIAFNALIEYIAYTLQDRGTAVSIAVDVDNKLKQLQGNTSLDYVAIVEALENKMPESLKSEQLTTDTILHFIDKVF